MRKKSLTSIRDLDVNVFVKMHVLVLLLKIEDTRANRNLRFRFFSATLTRISLLDTAVFVALIRANLTNLRYLFVSAS